MRYLGMICILTRAHARLSLPRALQVSGSIDVLNTSDSSERRSEWQFYRLTLNEQWRF
jgi:hypothetical protein